MDRVEFKREQVSGVLAQTRCRQPLTAGQVMTAQPRCIRPETTVLELIRLFHALQFRHLMVTDAGNRLIGVVSDRDVLRCLGPGERPQPEALTQTTAAEVMSSDLVTIGPEVPLERAVVQMIDYGISCLPVVDEGALVGIVTNTDLHVVLQVLLETARHASSGQPVVSTGISPHN